ASLAAFYNKIPVGHIEAGLRTFDTFNPYPEEMNRQLISLVSDIHFAPTRAARDNLRAVGIPQKWIFLTGNTAIDALLYSTRKVGSAREKRARSSSRKMVLVTAHRRESFGAPIKNICAAIRRLVALRDDIDVVYPVHLNPNIHQPVFEILKGIKRVHLVPTQPYPDFVRLMKNASVILTDSGGVQEEAPSLGKPVLVLREKSERMEAVTAGTATIVGTRPDDIVRGSIRALDGLRTRKRRAPVKNPFGDGKASVRIVRAIEHYFGLGARPKDFNPLRREKLF
ncbi:MAG: UDP-N-acetylglucosamine 2-epimerase (non-hydrolyzing), partial [Candidatus Omnitrophota bacterium]